MQISDKAAADTLDQLISSVHARPALQCSGHKCGHRAVGIGQWALGNGHWVVGTRRLPTCVSITLIKIKGDFIKGKKVKKNESAPIQ